jgi:hypothetical protein
LQLLILWTGATVPGLHGVGFTTPLPHADPGGHGEQSSALFSIVSFQ